MFALNKVAQLQILLPCPTTFLTSRASFRKKWMIFGLRSNFPCAVFLKPQFEVWKHFPANWSKIAGSKLQLVPFDTFLYNKLIPENTFLILLQNLPKQHLPTCPPAHLKHLKPMSALMFCVKNPIFRFKISFFSILGVAPLFAPLRAPLRVAGSN